jgi:hypothetical protein
MLQCIWEMVSSVFLVVYEKYLMGENDLAKTSVTHVT